MRKSVLLCLVTLLAPLSSIAIGQNAQPSAQQHKVIFRQSSVEKAWETAITLQKPMVVMFTSEHCSYCQKMLSETYGHPAIVQMLAGQTETVLAHAEDYPDLTKKLGIRGYPTTLLISPQGEVLDIMRGYVAPKAFAKRVSPLLARQNPRAPERSALAAATIAPKHTTER